MADNATLAHNFLNLWDLGATEFEVSTSGSTGIPKSIKLTRKSMIISAEITGSFLNVQSNDSIFCCLPVNRIGGMMQLVRSRVWNVPLRVAEPSLNPFLSLEDHYSITSLTGMQLAAVLKDEKSRKKLDEFRIVLLGGGDIHTDIEQKTAGMKPIFYHTYGMTETCSHIAMRRFGSDEYFHPMQGVEIRLNKDHCLEIKSAVTKNNWITTNDICSLSRDGFRILGRADNIINSGGIKIQAEQVEKQIIAHYKLPENCIILVGATDEILGQKALLLADGSLVPDKYTFDFSFIEDRYQRPKQIFYLSHFIFTETGKIDRPGTLKLLKND